ncbi:MAG TPA: hypothetical protein HA346_01060 [Thermoplasmata archaeon]|nr:hypothetical protein [Thermoplasmata archaeon]
MTESGEANTKNSLWGKLEDLENALRIEDEIMAGACDLHVHGSPGKKGRHFFYKPSMIDTAKKAAKAGMCALVFKSNEMPTSESAWLMEEYLKEWSAGKEGLSLPRIFGGVVLNHMVGGLNIEAVKGAINTTHGKIVWAPTNDAAYYRGTEKGIKILDENEDLRKEIKEILDFLHGYDEHVIFGTGHISPEEIRRITEYTKDLRIGVNITHPLFPLTKLTIEEMKEVTANGAYLEICASTNLPSVYLPTGDPSEVVDVIKAIGAKHCIISSDYGQPLNLDPINGLRMFVRILLSFGVSRTDVETMMKDNPRQLLGI